MKIPARFLTRTTLCLALAAASGCIRLEPPTLSAPDTRTYLLAPDLAAAAAQAPKTPKLQTVQLRPVKAVAPANGRAFIYRLDGKKYATDPYNLFLVPPDVIFSQALPPLLQAAGLAAQVFPPETHRRQMPFLDITITQLYGDFTDPAQPAAVLELTAALFVDHNLVVDECLFLERISIRTPIEANTAEALLAGWESALVEAAQIIVKKTRKWSPPPADGTSSGI